MTFVNKRTITKAHYCCWGFCSQGCQQRLQFCLRFPHCCLQCSQIVTWHRCQMSSIHLGTGSSQVDQARAGTCRWRTPRTFPSRYKSLPDRCLSMCNRHEYFRLPLLMAFPVVTYCVNLYLIKELSAQASFLHLNKSMHACVISGRMKKTNNMLNVEWNISIVDSHEKLDFWNEFRNQI